MVFEQECPRKRAGLFYLTEEKRAERFLAHNLSKIRQKYNSLDCLYSSKYFRLFYKRAGVSSIEISISKKFYGLAVERNKIRRVIKEIFRTKSLINMTGGVIVFSVFKPFAELSYKDASDRIEDAMKSFNSKLKKL